MTRDEAYERIDEFGISIIQEIYDEFEARTCSTCKWWQDEVCVNGDSPLCSDFTVGKFGCVLWEKQDDREV